MKPIKIVIEYEDGSIWYTENPTDIRNIGLALPKGIKWKHGVPLATLRAKYFIMLDEIVKTNITGYNKTELHEAMKPIIMRKFKDFPQYFINGVPEYSTAQLTREGWLATIDQLKVTADDLFGYIFKT